MRFTPSCELANNGLEVKRIKQEKINNDLSMKPEIAGKCLLIVRL